MRDKNDVQYLTQEYFMDKRKTPKLIVKNSSHQSDIPFLYIAFIGLVSCERPTRRAISAKLGNS